MKHTQLMKEFFMKKLFCFSIIIIVGLFAPLYAEKTPLNPLGRPAYTDLKTVHYLVWQDFNGWHIRWCTDGKEYVFSGEIKTKSGQLSQVKSLYPYLKKKVYVTESQRIQFEITDNKQFNGIDFISHSQKLKFRLYINGKGSTESIYVGMQAKHPNSIPFSLIPLQPGIQNTYKK